MLAAMPTVGMLPGAGGASPTVGMLHANADTESKQVSVTAIKNLFILEVSFWEAEKDATIFA